ncbi:MAG: hypothetical protein CL605_14490 [Altibacter sp.]|uniref:hypothetical protein n=1 Tax=Altibacter sp. TaxID=2024823 RepID=UPI000C8AFEB7|nr:hypothetical protein [Altibacter sp.]MAP56097.1 hypothetical protein [Altibacter sp.]
MKKLLKPAYIGFYLLTLITFFVVGLYYAEFIEAGKNQGLAGGAIVLGWGVLFGGIAFIASFFIAYKLAVRTLIRINWILLLLLAILWAVKFYEFRQRDSLQEESEQQFDPAPTQTTKPTSMLRVRSRRHLDRNSKAYQNEETLGMGYFSPNYYENPTLYFYGDPNLEKSLMEHIPYDSITFTRNKYNNFEIATAPPWLVPEMLKLDYDMLYFKIESITEEFIEVVVNAQNSQTSYVSRRSGRMKLWPEFLLGVNSVEFLPNSNEKVRARHFEASGVIQTSYAFMRPIRVKNDWMEVVLLDDGFQTVGKGWIQWKRDGKLLINFNLLS